VAAESGTDQYDIAEISIEQVEPGMSLVVERDGHQRQVENKRFRIAPQLQSRFFPSVVCTNLALGCLASKSRQMIC